MKQVFAYMTLAGCLYSTGASAETDQPLWTLSASGSWSELSSSDRDAVSSSVSLSRQFGDVGVGASIATSNGSDVLFEAAEITDRSSVYGSLWVSVPVGASYLDLTASYGQEDYEGQIVVTGSRFGFLDGSAADIASEVDSFAYSAALSRVFVQGDWDIIPNASLGWSQSDATTTASSAGGVAVAPDLSEEQNGWTATAGLGVGYVVNERLYIFSDVVGLYAENGASTGVSTTSRLGDVRATSRQTAEEVTWAEVSVGASLYATDTVTFSLSGGTTVGRDDEEVFVTTSISVGF